MQQPSRPGLAQELVRMSIRNKLISGVLILSFLVAIAILGSGLLRQARLDESSREFAIYVTPIVLSGQPRYEAQEDLEEAIEMEDPPTVAETFATFAHPSLLERQSSEDLGRYFYTVTLNLGPLQRIESITGGSEVPLFILDSQIPSAAYQLQVEFSRGTAQVDMEMAMEADAWQLTAFDVETSMLAD